MRAFLYARVSTGEQNEGMQLAEMQEFAKHRGWSVEIFPDVGQSGAKETRPELDRMMTLIRRRKCDVVLVYKFDRFARSLRFLLNTLEEFTALGVAFVSVRDNIDTTTPAGRLMFQMVGAFAEFERSLIAQRVKSGMANAKSRGLHVGRPALGLDAEEIASLRGQGLKWGAVAEKVGASATSCKDALRDARRKGLLKSPELGADSKALSVPVENKKDKT